MIEPQIGDTWSFEYEDHTYIWRIVGRDRGGWLANRSDCDRLSRIVLGMSNHGDWKLVDRPPLLQVYEDDR